MSMSSWPPEIIVEILVRLPVKSLMPCMCVSKQWHSFIVDPYFIKRHHCHSMKTNSDLNLITENYNHGAPSFLIVPFGDDGDFGLARNVPLPLLQFPETLGCFNGLVCLHSSHKEFTLWNPSIGKYKRLPLEPIDFPPNSSGGHIAVSGFGYEPIHDDYKLLRVVKFSMCTGLPEVKVYSLRLNSWTRVQGWPCGENFKFNLNSSFVPFNGALHSVITNFVDFERVIAFDLNTEKFTVYPLPIHCYESLFGIDVLGGCLCIWRNVLMSRHEIWMMKQYGVNESWVKYCSMERIGIWSPEKPIMVSKDGKKILWNDSLHFYWYDIESQRREQVEFHGSPLVEVFTFRQTLLCVGSLLLLNCDTVTEENQEKHN